MTNEYWLNTLSTQKDPDISFVVRDDFVRNLPQIITNIREITSWAQAQTESDRAMQLRTASDIEYAKRRCAQINKVIRAIDDKRKFVKNAYLQPYITFEDEVKTCILILSDAKNNLWTQVKDLTAPAPTKTKTYYLELSATKEQIKAVKEFLKIRKIKYTTGGSNNGKGE